MRKYLIIGMLCIGMSGLIAATGTVREQNAIAFPKLNTTKTDKFIAWYEALKENGEYIHPEATALYQKAKKLPTNQAPKGRSNAPKQIQQRHSEHKNEAVGCLKKHVLTQSDFCKEGVVITCPGYYCLGENIAFNPRQDHIPAITVRSDNVIVDLSTHVLSECRNAYIKFDDTSAIVVESGYNFITIKNGQIRNFANQGILVASDNIGSPEDHHGILIEDIIVTDIGKPETASDLQPYNTRGGIVVYGTTDCTIKNCEASGVTSFLDTEGICTFFTKNILIQNCLTHDNFADSIEGFSQGVGVNYFSDATVENCSAFDHEAGFIYGILVQIGQNSVVTNCQSNQNSGSTFCVGIGIGGVESSIVEHSQGNFNAATSDDQDENFNRFCTGIQIAQSTGVVDGCTASFNTAGGPGLSGGGVVGFDINTVDSCVVKNSTAEGNGSTASGLSISGGFDSDLSSNIVFENCVSIANNALTDTTNSNGNLGFYASIFPEGGPFANIVYRNCTSINHVSNVAEVLAAGFLVGQDDRSGETIIVFPTQILIDSCIAEGNTNTADPVNSGGVSIGNNTTNSSVVNCILKGNGVGLQVRGIDTVGNVFENNQITASEAFGILDTTDNLNSYALNYAYNPLGLTNFSGLPTATPIRTWEIGFAPSPVDNNGILDPLDNLDVVNTI